MELCTSWLLAHFCNSNNKHSLLRPHLNTLNTYIKLCAVGLWYKIFSKLYWVGFTKSCKSQKMLLTYENCNFLFLSGYKLSTVGLMSNHRTNKLPIIVQKNVLKRIISNKGNHSGLGLYFYIKFEASFFCTWQMKVGTLHISRQIIFQNWIIVLKNQILKLWRLIHILTLINFIRFH